MKIWYSKNDLEYRKFFKIEKKWANLMRSEFKREGEYHYFLTIFSPANCIQIEYVKNPFNDIDNEIFEIKFSKHFAIKNYAYTTYTVASRRLKRCFAYK